MEVILFHLLKRAKFLYESGQFESGFFAAATRAIFEQTFNLTDYLKLDDGVLNTLLHLLARLSRQYLKRFC